MASWNPGAQPQTTVSLGTPLEKEKDKRTVIQRAESWKRGLWTHKDVSIHSAWGSQRSFTGQMSWLRSWRMGWHRLNEERRLVRGQSKYEGRGLRRAWEHFRGAEIQWGSGCWWLMKLEGTCRTQMWEIPSVMFIRLGSRTRSGRISKFLSRKSHLFRFVLQKA